MNCEKCGAEIQSGGSVCNSCGAAVPAGEPVVGAVPEATAPPAPPTADGQSTAPTAPSAPSAPITPPAPPSPAESLSLEEIAALLPRPYYPPPQFYNETQNENKHEKFSLQSVLIIVALIIVVPVALYILVTIYMEENGNSNRNTNNRNDSPPSVLPSVSSSVSPSVSSEESSSMQDYLEPTLDKTFSGKYYSFNYSSRYYEEYAFGETTVLYSILQLHNFANLMPAISDEYIFGVDTTSKTTKKVYAAFAKDANEIFTEIMSETSPGQEFKFLSDQEDSSEQYTYSENGNFAVYLYYTRKAADGSPEAGAVFLAANSEMNSMEYFIFCLRNKETVDSDVRSGAEDMFEVFQNGRFWRKYENS